MPEGQKKLLILLAMLLGLQAFVTIVKYCYEVADDGRFGGDFIVFTQTAQEAADKDIFAIYGKDKMDGSDIASIVLDRKSVAAKTNIAPFVYPPHALLLLWPLAGLSYLQAVAVWSLLSVGLFYWLLFRKFGFRQHSIRLRVVMACIPMPMLLANLFSGQTGTWIAILFLLTMVLWSRQLLAGAVLGVLTIKPHLGLLWPLVLWMQKRWAMMAAAAATALAMGAVVTFWLGAGIWTDYFKATQFFSHYAYLAVDRFGRLAIAPFISLQAIGVPNGMAAACQAIISLGVAAFIIRLFREQDAGRQDIRFSLLAVGCLLVTPYTLVYDSPLMAVAVIPLIVRAWEKGWRNGLELVALVMVLVMPFAQAVFLPYHVPFGLLSSLTLFAVLWRWYKGGNYPKSA